MRKITKIKTKYYSKEILKYLLSAGAVYVAASSPYFTLSLMKKISPHQTVKKKRARCAFDYLKRRGLVEIKSEGHDVCIVLTEEGRKRAGKYQIDDLEIERPKKWDKKWRVVIFDIPNVVGASRNVFRKKLKEFGFYSLQKSVWVYPYSCKEEIALLREFFGLNKKQIRVLEVNKMEDDKLLRDCFKLS